MDRSSVEAIDRAIELKPKEVIPLRIRIIGSAIAVLAVVGLTAGSALPAFAAVCYQPAPPAPVQHSNPAPAKHSAPEQHGKGATHDEDKKSKPKEEEHKQAPAPKQIPCPCVYAPPKEQKPPTPAPHEEKPPVVKPPEEKPQPKETPKVEIPKPTEQPKETPRPTEKPKEEAPKPKPTDTPKEEHPPVVVPVEHKPVPTETPKPTEKPPVKEITCVKGEHREGLKCEKDTPKPTEKPKDTKPTPPPVASHPRENKPPTPPAPKQEVKVKQVVNVTQLTLTPSAQVVATQKAAPAEREEANVPGPPVTGTGGFPNTGAPAPTAALAETGVNPIAPIAGLAGLILLAVGATLWRRSRKEAVQS